VDVVLVRHLPIKRADQFREILAPKRHFVGRFVEILAQDAFTVSLPQRQKTSKNKANNLKGKFHYNSSFDFTAL